MMRCVVDKVSLERGFPVRCHSTNGPHSSSSTCWSYQKDKRPKPGNRPEISGLSEMEKCWIGKYFHIFVFKANNYQLMAVCVFACANSYEVGLRRIMILVKWIPERLCCLSVQFPVCLSVCLSLFGTESVQGVSAFVIPPAAFPVLVFTNRY